MKIKRLERQLRAILYKDLKEYIAVIGSLTGDEEIELREWVAKGNSVKNNPYLLYDESGWPIDFINGCRIGNDMYENPSNYAREEPATLNNIYNAEEDLPF